MRAKLSHAWNLTPTEARALQERLAAKLTSGPRPEPLRLVAGADVAYDQTAGLAAGGVVVWDAAAGRVVEQALAVHPIDFPYLSGLLTFREGPALLAALERLESRPEVILFDGQGQAHPRRLGLAAHLGVLLDCPTIGCAKSRLFGQPSEPGLEKGCQAELRHPDGGRIIGRLVRTRTNVKPVYVSPGHKAELDWAVRLVLDLAARYRLPEPIRAAHRLVTKARAAGLRTGMTRSFFEANV